METAKLYLLDELYELGIDFPDNFVSNQLRIDDIFRRVKKNMDRSGLIEAYICRDLQII